MRTRLRGRRVFLWIYVGEWLDRFVLGLFRRGIIYSFCSYIYLGSSSLCFLCSFMIFSRYTKKASSTFLVVDPKSLLGIIYSLCSYIYLGSNSLCFEEPKQKSLRPSPSGREGETHRARQCVSVETHIMTLHLL